MVIARRPRLTRFGMLLVGMLATILILTYPSLGSGPFLGDQLDCILNGQRLLHGEVSGLSGVIMSGTAVRTLGPLTGIVFGLPARLGVGPAGLQLVIVLVILSALAYAFRAMRKHDRTLANAFLALTLLTPAFWWHLSILWANMLTLACAFLFLGFFCEAVVTKRPSWTVAGLATLIWSLHVHFNPIVALPVVLLSWFATDARTCLKPTRGFWAALTFLLLGVLPYAVSESVTGLANSRAAIAHIGHSVGKPSHSVGISSALEAVYRSVDPYEWGGTHALLGSATIDALCLAGLFIIAGIAVVRVARLRRAPAETRPAPGLRDWLWLSAAALPLAETIYFLVMNRDIPDYHYLSFSLPFAVLPLAIVSTLVAERAIPSAAYRVSVVALAAAMCAAIPIARAKQANHGWKFANIAAALHRICGPGLDVAVDASAPFVTYTAGDPSVLEYVMDHDDVGCHYAESASVLLFPSGDAAPAEMAHRGRSYVLRTTVPPGINVYQAK